MRSRFLILSLVVLVAGCSSKPTTVAVAPTLAPVATRAPIPTPTAIVIQSNEPAPRAAGAMIDTPRARDARARRAAPNGGKIVALAQAELAKMDAMSRSELVDYFDEVVIQAAAFEGQAKTNKVNPQLSVSASKLSIALGYYASARAKGESASVLGKYRAKILQVAARGDLLTEKFNRGR